MQNQPEFRLEPITNVSRATFPSETNVIQRFQHKPLNYYLNLTFTPQSCLKQPLGCFLRSFVSCWIVFLITSTLPGCELWTDACCPSSGISSKDDRFYMPWTRLRCCEPHSGVYTFIIPLPFSLFWSYSPFIEQSKSFLTLSLLSHFVMLRTCAAISVCSPLGNIATFPLQYILTFQLPLTLTSFPVIAAETTPTAWCPLPPCFTGPGQEMSGAWLLLNMILRIRHKVQSWIHQTRKSHFPQSGSSYKCWNQTWPSGTLSGAQPKWSVGSWSRLLTGPT